MVDDNMKAFLSRTRTKARKVTKSTPSSTESTLPIDKILPRPHGDTRDLNPGHIDALVESIVALGLISAITVDINGALIAGGHRRAAIEHLQESQPEIYQKWFAQGVPVRRYDFDAAENPELALAIEAAENEKRRDYTPAEVRELADRLVEAGYRKTEGRPKKGEKALIPSLSVIVGKSHRTLHRYLDTPTDQKTLPRGRVYSDIVPKVSKSLSQLINADDCPDDVVKLAEKLLKKLDRESEA